MKLHELTAHQLHDDIKAQKVTSEEILKAVKDQIGRVEKKVHAFARLIQENKVPDQTKRLSLPIAIKDNICIAGHETTALLMSWVWTLLSKHPEIEANLHQELDSVLAGKAPTIEDLANLPYANWIIKETLRLYPPAWFFMRETQNEVSLRDDTLEKGKVCLIIPYATHRDPRWYDKPDAFIPERWDNDFEKSLPKGAYIPFGLGARVCIGNGLALLEAQLVLATLAQRFRVELVTKPEMTKNGITLGFQHPVTVRLHQRSK